MWRSIGLRRSDFFAHVQLSRERLLNHPGHSSQKSHGRQRKAGAGTLHESDEALRGAYTYTDGPTGMSTSVRKIIRTDRTVFVSIDIHDRSGAKVGESLRTLKLDRTDTVMHDRLELEPGMQGQGFASRFNAQAEQAYREHGIRRIELQANVDVGGYAWARAGYDFKSTADRARIARRVARRVTRGEFSPQVREQAQRVADNPRSSAIDFAMIGHSPGATTWPGKELMLGSTWDGVKEL